MKLEIEVTEVGGKMVFNCEGSALLAIRATWLMEGGSITVMRDGKVFDKATQIRPCGAHDGETAIRDLREVCREAGLDPVERFNLGTLIPEYFRLGDKILIELHPETECSWLELFSAVNEKGISIINSRLNSMRKK